MPQFQQVDVFSLKKFKGNPVAVFFDADNLSTEEMQAMALWTNLSETTFVLKPSDPNADYQCRIFTPVEELPFAGHPTIGTCYAVTSSGLVKPKNGKVIQQCKAGLVELTIDESGVEFKLPYYHFSAIDQATTDEVAKAVDSTAIIAPGVLVDDGPKWACFELKSGEDVMKATPNWALISKVSSENGWTGIELFGKYSDGTYELRNLAPDTGVAEDPVCGLGLGALGATISQYTKRNETHFSIRQGRPIGRDGHIAVRVEDANVYVKGKATTIINGTY